MKLTKILESILSETTNLYNPTELKKSADKIVNNLDTLLAKDEILKAQYDLLKDNLYDFDESDIKEYLEDSLSDEFEFLEMSIDKYYGNFVKANWDSVDKLGLKRYSNPQSWHYFAQRLVRYAIDDYLTKQM